MDEALSVGDASFKRKCKAKINEIISSGTTVLYVSHNMDSVKEICDRAIYLKKGQVMYDGEVEKAFELYVATKEAEKAKKAKKAKEAKEKAKAAEKK